MSQKSSKFIGLLKYLRKGGSKLSGLVPHRMHVKILIGHPVFDVKWVIDWNRLSRH
jgi:hypothetical protein